MAEPIEVFVTQTTRYPSHLHLHFHPDDSAAILSGIEDIRATLEEMNVSNAENFDQLDAAIANMKEGVMVDVDHLVQLVAAANATHAEDQATIDALNADAAATKARIDQAMGEVSGFDADPSFPPAPAPEPAPEPAPTPEPTPEPAPPVDENPVG